MLHLTSSAVVTLVAVALLRIFFIGTPLFPPLHWPEGKTAQCRDRWFSASLHRSGTCSSHHGVAYWRYPSSDPVGR
jgi:hypothetical protein